MGQTLEAALDFDTASAVANAIRFINALNQLEAELNQTSAAANLAGASLARIGAAAGQSNVQINTMFNQMNIHANTIAQTNVQVNNLAASQARLGGVTSQLGSQVMNWVGAYAGLSGVNKIIDDYMAKMQQAVDMQRKMAGENLSRDEIKNQVAVQLGMPTVAGEVKADKLMRELMASAGVSYKAAGDVLMSSASAGVDVQTPAGQAYADELAKFQRREKLDGNTLVAFTRYAEQRGKKNAEGLKQLIAEGDIEQQLTQGIDMGEFWRAKVAASAGGLAEGMDPLKLSAMLSTEMSITGTGGQDAANKVRQILAGARGTTKKSKAFVAAAAVDQGVVTSTPMDDASVRARADAGDEVAQDVLEKREKLQLEQDQLATDAEKITADDDAFKMKRHTAAELTAHDRSIESRRQSVARSTHALAKKRTDLARAEKALGALQAAQSLTMDQRLDIVIKAMVDAQTPEEQAEIADAFGMQANRLTQIRGFTSREAQEHYHKLLEANRKATPAMTDAANAQFERLQHGKNTRAESKRELDRIAAMGPGESYAEQLLRNATNARDIRVIHRDYAPDADSSALQRITSFTETESKQVAVEGWRILDEDISKAIDEYKTTDVEAANAMLTLQAQVRTHRDSFGNWVSGEGSQNQLQEMAAAFGNLKEQIDRGQSAGVKSTITPGGAEKLARSLRVRDIMDTGNSKGMGAKVGLGAMLKGGSLTRVGAQADAIGQELSDRMRAFIADPANAEFKREAESILASLPSDNGWASPQEEKEHYEEKAGEFVDLQIRRDAKKPPAGKAGGGTKGVDRHDADLSAGPPAPSAASTDNSTDGPRADAGQTIINNSYHYTIHNGVVNTHQSNGDFLGALEGWS